MLSSGKYWAILLGLPNSVLAGSGVTGLGSSWSDARFFLMLPCAGGCCCADRIGTCCCVEPDQPSDESACECELAASMRDRGVRTRGSVGPDMSGVRVRLTPKGMVGTSFLCVSTLMPHPGVPTRGVPSCASAFSLVSRPFVRTKAADRRW